MNLCEPIEKDGNILRIVYDAGDGNVQAFARPFVKLLVRRLRLSPGSQSPDWGPNWLKSLICFNNKTNNNRNQRFLSIFVPDQEIKNEENSSNIQRDSFKTTFIFQI